MHLKMSGKRRPFCLGLNMLITKSFAAELGNMIQTNIFWTQSVAPLINMD